MRDAGSKEKGQRIKNSQHVKNSQPIHGAWRRFLHETFYPFIFYIWSMAPWLRKISSFFLLLVFMYPTAAEAIHTFEHRNDTHCTEHNYIHVEGTEHHCSICDFVPAPLVKPTWEICSVKITYFNPQITANDQIFKAGTDYLPVGLRGPPVCC